MEATTKLNEGADSMKYKFEIIGYDFNGAKFGELLEVEASSKEAAFRKVSAIAEAYGSLVTQIWAGREKRGTLVQAELGDINGDRIGVWNLFDGDLLDSIDFFGN